MGKLNKHSPSALEAHGFWARLEATFARPIAFVQRQLSASAYLGLNLLVGVAVVLVAFWSFLQIMGAVVDGHPIITHDHEFAVYLNERTRPGLTQLVFVITTAGSGLFLGMATGALALYLALLRSWYRLLALLVIVPGGSLLNVAIKHEVQRSRPVLDKPIVLLETFSFPSAHAMGATLFYGFAAIMTVSFIRSWQTRLGITIAALLVVLVVSFSRLYLGLHFLSDVVAGILAGLAWLAFGWTATETFRRRSKAKGKGGLRAARGDPA